MDILIKVTLGMIVAIMIFFVLLGAFSNMSNKDKNQSDDSWYM